MSPDDEERSTWRCHTCTLRYRGRRHTSPHLVLNVDDKSAHLYVRERLLREHGFSVINAATGQAALEIAARIKPELVLLDVLLPDADGRDICRQMKADPQLQGVHIVLISAALTGHVNQLESVRWGGADAFVLEPLAPDLLMSVIRKTLGHAA